MKDEMASKRDLFDVKAGLDGKIDQTRVDLEAKIDRTRVGLEAKIDQTRADLEVKIDRTRADLEVKIDQTRVDLEGKIDQTRVDLEGKIDRTAMSLEASIQGTRKDLQTQIDVLDFKTDRIEERLTDFQEETRRNFSTVLTAIDGLAGLITNGRTEKAAVNSALYRLEDRVEDHEKRIGSLESRN